MDGKVVAIGVLALVAVLLGGLVAGGLRQEGTAYAQGGVYATYLATAAMVRDQFVSFAILDTDARALIFYDVELPRHDLKPTSAKVLTRDFPHVRP